MHAHGPARVKEISAPRLTVKPVSIPELDAWWPMVVPAIEEVKARNHPSWTVEQVLDVLRENRGWLALTMWGDLIVGVTIICGDGDQFAQKTDMLVWIAWADPLNVKRGIDRDVRQFTQNIIDRVAANAGFRTIRMHSPRKGWMKVAKELGYELQEYVFVKRVGTEASRG